MEMERFVVHRRRINGEGPGWIDRLRQAQVLNVRTNGIIRRVTGPSGRWRCHALIAGHLSSIEAPWSAVPSFPSSPKQLGVSVEEIETRLRNAMST